MTTFREAVKKLQIIYNECSPDAKNKKKEENSLDEFTRLRKTTHAEVKRTREVRNHLLYGLACLLIIK